jgi:hypothetical protein
MVLVAGQAGDVPQVGINLDGAAQTVTMVPVVTTDL